MKIDQDRIQTILQAEHAYYGSRDIPIRRDVRWIPMWDNLIAPQLLPTMRVLDVGCGSGTFLLELHASFQSGLGIEYDPEHIRIAEEEKRQLGVENVEFRLMEFPQESTQLQPESFDFLISLRGPVPDNPENLQAALRLLRPEGLIFCEEIGENHDHEVRQVFANQHNNLPIEPPVKALSLALERQGVSVRLAADIFTKWHFPDVYAWLEYQCNLWTWLGVSLPKPDDPRIAQFAERNTVATGEIETTHHVAWVAGVKR
jgi:SAM-dependent methyltransferase